MISDTQLSLEKAIRAVRDGVSPAEAVANNVFHPASIGRARSEAERWAERAENRPRGHPSDSEYAAACRAVAEVLIDPYD